VLEQGDRIVTDASHQADLVIDEDERRVVGRKRLIGTALCGHCVLLCWCYFSRQARRYAHDERKDWGCDDRDFGFIILVQRVDTLPSHL